MSDTPRTDAAIIERRHIHKICGCLELLELVDADVARKLERECDQARAERNEARNESLEQARLLAMSGDREMKLLAQLDQAQKT